jgi:galactokinase
MGIGMDLRGTLAELYGNDAVEEQLERYSGLDRGFTERFGKAPSFRFSAPGRSELGGNHTDHNHGRVLAASVDLDTIAAVSPLDEPVVRMVSEGYAQEFRIDLNALDPVPEEEGNTSALIRGIAAGFRRAGHGIGGFEAYVSSRVASGSGLSSSASVEVLIGTVFDRLYNGNRIDSVDIAKIGRYAENRYFGKPCGLMDQIACAHGGIVAIDFFDPETPLVTGVRYDFSSKDYLLAVVHTGGSHDDLTPHYAAVFEEMRAVASFFGREYCREIPPEDVLSRIDDLRREAGDRAVLRFFHFADDNLRVKAQIEALERDDIDEYLETVAASGASSWTLLQNCSVPERPREQGIPLALALAERILNGRGAARVHGGGFAGTIQVYVPVDSYDEFASLMERTFGKGTVTPLKIRSLGSICLNDLQGGPDPA